MLKLVKYTEVYLEYSWSWLNDPEIKELTATPDFTKEDQLRFYNVLKEKEGYHIYGIEINSIEAGACGLKKVKEGRAEYWGYLGEKKFWGKGFGKMILDNIQALAIVKGIYCLYLEVGKENIRAQNLYLKCGFSIIEQKCNSLIMEKHLNIQSK
jgi:RimJ/RimL family protein N-acetyltransferase